MEKKEWLFVNSLKSGDVVEVRTLNTLYTMRVIDPNGAQVLVSSNGKLIALETTASVMGKPLIIMEQ